MLLLLDGGGGGFIVAFEAVVVRLVDDLLFLEVELLVEEGDVGVFHAGHKTLV